MSDLSLEEQQLFEKLFRMENGFFLNMNSSQMRLFFSSYDIDINSNPFNEYGRLMADKVRAFWRFASNQCVVRVHRDLLKLVRLERRDSFEQTSSSFKMGNSHHYISADIQKAEEILYRLEQMPDSQKKYQKVKTPQERHSSHTALKGSLLVIAQDLWKENPNLSQSDIMRKNLFKEKLKNLCETLGVEPKKDTITKWLREIDPRNQENKPGPKKNK